MATTRHRLFGTVPNFISFYLATLISINIGGLKSIIPACYTLFSIRGSVRLALFLHTDDAAYLQVSNAVYKFIETLSYLHVVNIICVSLCYFMNLVMNNSVCYKSKVFL